MKKVLSILAATLMVVSSYSQAFWEYTSYAGAFAPSPASRWTDTWTNWDPQNVNYGATTVNVTANITTNTTWTNTNVYYINNQFIYVDSLVTLTIEPGTVIRSSGNGALIVGRGAKIYAQGTAAQPIIFTSNAPVGSRDYGDWGGVVFCGAARNNLPSSPNALAEGGIGSLATMRGVHGGTNNNDSSGVFSYVRIEYAGIPLGGANSELNGLSLYSVGSKTKIDHVQVSYSGDDSFEWFGGCADAKYLVAYRGWDDDFDTDNGFSGRVQFGYSVRDSRYADQSGSNGFESDNDASGTTNTPKTSAFFSNITIIGPKWTGNPDTTNALYRRALHIRRNSKISVYNSVFTGYPTTGLYLDGYRTAANYCNDSMAFCGNTLAQMDPKEFFQRNGGTGGADTFCLASGNGALATIAMGDNNDTLNTTVELLLGSTFGNSLTDYDARPTAVSPVATGSCWAWNTSFMGVEDQIEVLGLTLYPNPTEGFTNLAFDASESGNLMINILDMNGRMVKTMNNMTFDQGKNTYQLDVQGLSTGVYMVAINTNNTVRTQKLIIR